MAETFGEADIILRLRLDELNREISKSEQMVNDSTQRVEARRIESIQSVARATREAGDAFGPDFGERIALVGVLTSKTALLSRAMAAVGTAVTASGVALYGLVAAGALVQGMLFEARDRAIRFAKELFEAHRAMDGSKERAREFADELERIPVLGGLISTSFRIFSKDAQQSDEALAGLVTVIEDGEVKTRAWANAGAYLIRGLSLGFVDLRKGIDEANEAMGRMQTVNDFRSMGAGFNASLFAASDQAEQTAARDAELAQLEGVDRVRAAERHRMEDLLRGFQLAQRAAQQNHSERMQQLREQQKSGDLSEKQYNNAAAILNADLNRQIGDLMAAQARSQASLAAASDARIAAAAEELRITQEMAEAERQREEARREADMARLEAVTRAAELRAIGEDLEAQRVEIEQRTQEAIAQAMADGNEQAAELERRRGEALLQIVENAAARRAEAERRAEEARMQAMEEARAREVEAARRAQEQITAENIRQFDTRERLRSQILQERLRQQGRDLEAERERIESDAYLDIQRFLDEGHEEAARLRETLRDLQLAGLDMNQGQGRVREIGNARLAAGAGVGGGNGKNEVEVKGQDKVLRELGKQSSSLETIAARGVFA